MRLYKKILLPILCLACSICAALGAVACGEDQEHTVTYVYGNGEADVQRTVEDGALAVEPKDPEWEGYLFDGWFLEEELYDFSTPVHSDITLEAEWTLDVPEGQLSVTWKVPSDGSDAYEYRFDGTKPVAVDYGTEVSFRVWTSPYYVGTPVVTAGETVLTADADGKYTFAVTDNVEVSVGGLTPDTIRIEGLGTESNPYIITRPSQLEKITSDINNPANAKFNSAHIRLDADLDLKGVTVNPIGDTLNDAHFEGYFDGNGHSVSNFKINEETGIVGFFGYLVQGVVANLTVNTDLYLEMLDEQNYIVGGIVSYNMGGDIVGCNFNGDITAELSYEAPAVYLGGISGFVQGYGTDISATVSYCNVNATVNSVGTQSLFTTGGIVGASVGTAESAPVETYNCTFNGTITGKTVLAGGIVGYLREYSAVANAFSTGEVKAQSSDADVLAAAGGIVGLAENETAVSFSLTTAESSAAGSQLGMENITSGKIIGGKYKDGTELVDRLTSVDGKTALEYNCYHSGTGSVQKGGTTYDLSDFADVKALFNWTDDEWTFEGGVPVAVYEEEAAIAYTVSVSFSGETVTREGHDGEPLSLTNDEIEMQGGYIPVNWIYGGSGMNTFIADSGNVSFGYFLDAECTQRIPSAMLLTQDTQIYVGFADYNEVVGEYHAIMTSTEDHNVVFILDNNGMATMELDGMIAYYMYVYDGEKVLIRGAYLANLIYNNTAGMGAFETDFYFRPAQDGEAFADSNEFRMYDNVFYIKENVHEITQEIKFYRPTAAYGEWYQPDGRTVQFFANGTGYSESTVGMQQVFTYDCEENTVTIYYGSQTLTVTISEDGKSMTNASGATLFSTVNKFDEFGGTWETEYGRNVTVSFDGKGVATYGGQTYDYTVQDGVLSFNGITVRYNEDELLELTENGVTSVFGREGSFMGTWVETMLDYEVEFYGIGKDGYGFGYDSNGVDFTYTATSYAEAGGEVGWELVFYYRTVSYGYAYLMPSTVDDSVFLAGAVYTESVGALYDMYNLSYVDEFIGSWNAEDGSSLAFNGNGGYNVNYNGAEGVWIVEGEVMHVSGTTVTEARYYFSRETGLATFTLNGVDYTATLGNGTITVTPKNGTPIVYKQPDTFGGIMFQGENALLGFNGKSNVGLGKAQLSLNGADLVEYDYVLNEEETQATLSQGGTAVYTATINEETFLLDLATAQGQQVAHLGYYSSMAEKVYIAGANGAVELKIDGYFGLDGYATGTFGGVEIGLVYIDENNAVIYEDGILSYVLVYQDENNVALFYATGELLAVLCVADGWGGTYEAENGDSISIDGRSLVIDGYYASANVVIGDETYSFVYEQDGDELIIYELDRSGESDELIPRYSVSRINSSGAIAYEGTNGTIYVTEIEE